MKTWAVYLKPDREACEQTGIAVLSGGNHEDR
jgi:hypothetical protein